MKIKWRIGNYGEVDDKPLRALKRYINVFWLIFKDSSFKVEL